MASAAAAVSLTAVLPLTASAGGATVPDRAAATDIEVIRLDCTVRVADSGPVVRCDWSEPQASAAAAVRLFRLDPAVDAHRRLVHRTGVPGRTGFTDTDVRPGHRYAYAIVVVNADGRVVGRSRADRVRVPRARDVEALGLRCAIGPAGQAVVCEWSRPTSRDASVVTLWRMVDRGRREVVGRFRPSGPNVYRDLVPAGAKQITSGVVATDRSGVAIGRSRPTTVRIPMVDARSADPARRDGVAP
jgi:hypothetical protein